MAEIGVENEVAKQGSQGGSEEFQTWSEERRIFYLTALQSHQKNLNEYYNYQKQNETGAIAGTASDRRKEMNKQIRDNLKGSIERILKEQVHKSSKGDVASIVPKGLIDQIRAIEEKVQQDDIITSLKNIRESVYGIVDQQGFKAEAIKTMKTITQLQEELTGIQEEIGVTFREGGFVKLIRIPMDQFLTEMQSAISLSKVAALDVTSGDPWKLDINFNSSVIQQLKDINLRNGGSGQGIKLTTEKEFFEDFMLRSDSKYDVLQSGFVAEALARSEILGKAYEYTQDNLAWYKGFDVYGRDKNNNIVGVSMKNAMFGSPTLLRINSLHTALNQLIKALSRRKSATEVANYIRENIYKGITGLDDNIENTINKKVVSILSG